MKRVMIVTAVLAVLVFVLGLIYRQGNPVVTPPARTEAEQTHRTELADQANLVLHCLDVVAEYRRYSEHSPNETRARDACVEVLENDRRQQRH